MDLSFATLEPANALAKLAFSSVYDAILQSRQRTKRNSQMDIPAAERISVESRQRYHEDVLRFQREMDNLEDENSSESSSDSDTDVKSKNRYQGMVWTGRYVLGLQLPPYEPDVGWVAGKGLGGNKPYTDIFFCTTAFSKRHNINLRSSHVRFNFDQDNRAFFVSSMTSSHLARLAVNGVTVGRELHALNQHNMKIQLGLLEYDFQYTDVASSNSFIGKRREYMVGNITTPPVAFLSMPTPRRNTRTIGRWTLGEPRGKGSTGSVFLGSNRKNEVVAVKIMALDSESKSLVDGEIAAYQALTALAEKHNDGGRLVRLKETIDPREDKNAVSFIFDEVCLVLEPMAPITVHALADEGIVGGLKGMAIEAAAIFRQALLGLKFMHDNGWVHGNIKPSNIGVVSRGRAVLLDLGQAQYLGSDDMSPARPGIGGTLNYLAPEREMIGYDHSADIWSMGCIGFLLTYGYHPFTYPLNPWRPGDQYTAVRPLFQLRHEGAIDRLLDDYTHYFNHGAADPNPHFVHLGDILAKMLRHQFAMRQRDRAQRADVDRVLNHRSWIPLLSK
ncbi:kinase-like domain-containing protein [Durotheca rogersii]|uniref:kinase-like domain-containing protein n=1 Tax=Durotheca rogersii TaxID=419775 RepID=UPI002220643E|nr:kinase-like domain-containing protein [Durotheca rogersii]KAI5865840.1 kinase-like domain-containing protein [Durotheca rogersii]